MNLGYMEIDQLGGKDPYSSSKAFGRIMISSYHRTFWNKTLSLQLGEQEMSLVEVIGTKLV